MYVEADFLTALVKDDDWLRDHALAALQDRDDLETSMLAVAEVLVVLYDRDDAAYDVDAPRALSNLVALVPIDPREHKAAVLATVDFLRDHDLTPFDAFHAGVVATREVRVLSTEQDYDDVGLERVPLAEEYGS